MSIWISESKLEQFEDDTNDLHMKVTNHWNSAKTKMG